MDSNKELIEELFQLSFELSGIFPKKDIERISFFKERIKKFSSLAIDQAKNIKIDVNLAEKTKIFKNHPVFIGGCIRSGTTLVNSLLDYNSEIVALLPDSLLLKYWFNLARKISKESYFNKLAMQYISEMFYQVRHNLPIDLLKSKSRDVVLENYSKFAAYFKYFIDHSENLSDQISALAQAIFLVNGQLERGDNPKMWAEKSPLNVFHFKKMLEYFPKARLIQIIRNPYANWASIKRLQWRSWRIRSNMFVECRSLKKTHQAVLKNAQEFRDKVITFQYRNIVSRPEEFTKNICNFLDLDSDNFLKTTTIFGLEDTPNSSHFQYEEKEKFAAGKVSKDFLNRYKEDLSSFEMYYITKKFKKFFAVHDYQIIDLGLNIFQKITFFFRMLFGEISVYPILIFRRIKRILRKFSI